VFEVFHNKTSKNKNDDDYNKKNSKGYSEKKQAGIGLLSSLTIMAPPKGTRLLVKLSPAHGSCPFYSSQNSLPVLTANPAQRLPTADSCQIGLPSTQVLLFN
jgi:hypothetical protein